jgi:hypothetical protein
MNRKRNSILEKKADLASTESRIEDVIRSLQEVEKALEKIDRDSKKSDSIYLNRHKS